MNHFSAYCPCHTVCKNSEEWKAHLQTCGRLTEVVAHGAIEFQYPDLHPLREEEVPMLRQGGLGVWELPRYARVDEGDKILIENDRYAESLPLYVARLESAEEGTRERALAKLSQSEEAAKALVALLKCTEPSEHASALAEFADNV